jgi:RNA polymerase sigma factor for flagellar operon FliA
LKQKVLAIGAALAAPGYVPFVQTGDREQRARELIPLVHDLAQQLVRRLPEDIGLDDLIGAGMLGLATALARFDPERAGTFRSYAETRIRGEMVDELRRRDMMSREARTSNKRLRCAVEALSRALNRPVTDEEVAEHLALSLDELYALQLKVSDTRIVFRDEIDGTATGTSAADAVQLKQLRERLVAEIDALPERQRTVLWLVYVEELTLREAGEVLGVTPSRVCQIRTEAERRLRDRLCAPAELAA